LTNTNTHEMRHHGRQQVPVKRGASLLHDVHQEENKMDDASAAVRGNLPVVNSRFYKSING